MKLCFQESLDDEKTFGKDHAFDILVGTMLDNSMMEEAIEMFRDKIQREKATNKCIDQVTRSIFRWF